MRISLHDYVGISPSQPTPAERALSMIYKYVNEKSKQRCVHTKQFDSPLLKLDYVDNWPNRYEL